MPHLWHNIMDDDDDDKAYCMGKCIFCQLELGNGSHNGNTWNVSRLELTPTVGSLMLVMVGRGAGALS